LKHCLCGSFKAPLIDFATIQPLYPLGYTYVLLAREKGIVMCLLESLHLTVVDDNTN